MTTTPALVGGECLRITTYWLTDKFVAVIIGITSLMLWYWRQTR